MESAVVGHCSESEGKWLLSLRHLESHTSDIVTGKQELVGCGMSAWNDQELGTVGSPVVRVWLAAFPSHLAVLRDT